MHLPTTLVSFSRVSRILEFAFSTVSREELLLPAISVSPQLVGDLIAFLDHDDLWPAGRHEAMVQALMADPQLDAVFGRIRIRLEPGGILWSWMLHQDGRHAPGSNLGNALYRSDKLRRIGGFDENLRFGEDLDYFNRLQKAGIRFALCDVDAMIYRRHANNLTNDQQRMKSMIFDLIRRRMGQTRQTKSQAE